MNSSSESKFLLWKEILSCDRKFCFVTRNFFQSQVVSSCDRNFFLVSEKFLTEEGIYFPSTADFLLWHEISFWWTPRILLYIILCWCWSYLYKDLYSHSFICLLASIVYHSIDLMASQGQETTELNKVMVFPPHSFASA